MELPNRQDLGCIESSDSDSGRSNLAKFDQASYPAKLMARQQLEVSTDSPFKLPDDISLDHLERARLLREETDQIKKQLDLVRTRLNDFNQAKQTSPSKVDQPEDLSPGVGLTKAESKSDERKHFELNQQATSSDNQFHPRNRTSNLDGRPSNQANAEQTRIRPLTGKADCPNCECDKRRQSICDNCVSFQQSVVRSTTETCVRQPTFLTGEQHPNKEPRENLPGEAAETSHVHHDERPLRPAKCYITDADKPKQTSSQPIHIHREIVPNQLFTIGKTLNDKRVELAKAIDDLQLMMDRVKKRGERLDQERKVAQLYKNQWRFGPTIGGASGLQNGQHRARANGNYQSRLDPQLARDSNTLMGFQHKEPSMKLRQYGGSNISLNVRQPSRGPQAKPRYSMGRMPNVAQQNATSSRLSKGKELSGSYHLRSKSLDSLQQVDKILVTARQASPAIKPRVISHKDENLASSMRGSPTRTTLDDETRGPEEELEEELNDEATIAATSDSKDDGNRSGTTDEVGAFEQQLSAGNNRPEHPARKMSWVPVFGETEIKTVDRRQPSRKTLVLNNQSPASGQRPPGSILRPHTSSILSRASAMKQRSHSAVSPNSRNDYGRKLMNEATKKLKFANNLLEREKHDSRSKNQLIVCNKLRPPPARSARARSETQTSYRVISSQCSGLVRDRQVSAQGAPREPISGTHREILQGKHDEQHRILAQQSGHSVSCCCEHHHPSHRSPSPSRRTKSKSIATARSQHPSSDNLPLHDAKHQLAAHLKARLEKTKSRLVEMLEEERAKHQQLERRVDSSLRRQTDLQAENELLRQSLNRCIDTCLRDISSTFESMREIIVDSAFSNRFEGSSEVSSNYHGINESTDVAQLIASNRHLRQMRNHIDSIESQRRSLFEELSSEKIQTKQLELQLIESKLERDRLIEANKSLERKLLDDRLRAHEVTRINRTEPQPSTSKDLLESGANTSSVSEAFDVSQQPSQADISDKTTNGSDEHFTSTTSTTFDSIDIYRQYIQSMTPDLEAIKRERRIILDEFDSIKRMLANMND